LSEVVYRSEMALLGMLLEQRGLSVDNVFVTLPPSEWSSAHILIAEVLQGMNDAGEEINLLTVMQKLTETGMLNRIGGAPKLYELVRHSYDYGHDRLLEFLVANATRRKLNEIGHRAQLMAQDPEIEPETIRQRMTEDLGQVGVYNGEVTTLGWPGETTDPEPNFVIPALLAEDDRVMITGYEGGGKTVLCRQLVAAVVVGRHPFLFSEFEPQPALHVDLENPQYLSDNAYRGIRNRLMAENVHVPDLLHRLSPRVFSVFEERDVAWLLRAVRKVQPKLIAIGPLKNMVGGNDLNEERVAVKVCDLLNRIRAETGAALVVEAHASWESRKTDWRPRGSSALVGWPEFGFGMKPLSVTTPRAAELVSWRGSRVDNRYWPQFLAEGTVWPWVEDPRLER